MYPSTELIFDYVILVCFEFQFTLLSEIPISNFLSCNDQEPDSLRNIVMLYNTTVLEDSVGAPKTFNEYQAE